MQPSGYPIDLDKMYKIWQYYIEYGYLSKEDISTSDVDILESWNRCLNRLDPFAKFNPTVIKKETFLQLLETKNHFLSLATPYLEDCYQFMEGFPAVIVLADRASSILNILGDTTLIKHLKSIGFYEGSIWAEGYVGTNALAIAIQKAIPAQVVGSEHFFKTLHPFTSTAAPVFDIKGDPIGTVGMLYEAEQSSSQTISLIMATARAISNQLQTNIFVKETNTRLIEMNTILENINDGIVAWNENGIITHVNRYAANILDIVPQNILGENIFCVINFPDTIMNKILQNVQYKHMDMTIDLGTNKINIIASIMPVLTGDKEPLGHLMCIKAPVDVRKLINFQVGSEALLTLKDIPAKSASILKVLKQAKAASKSSSPVLIRGEEGVGKNSLGRAIHNESKRNKSPFIAINCNAIPRELMASEFLGYDQDEENRGRPSKFELADGGTLFLDRIECLSTEMQSALVHLIETGMVMRLNSTRQIPVDIKIIASTSEDLELSIKDGIFNRRLYYAFFIFSIVIPPLRKRQEDIPIIIQRHFHKQFPHEKKYFDKESMAILKNYRWPGNTRELENVAERAFNFAQDKQIRVTDLPEAVRKGRCANNNILKPELVMTTSEAEREAIIHSGWAAMGNASEMARLLQISRTTLWRKLKIWNISLSQFK